MCRCTRKFKVFDRIGAHFIHGKTETLEDNAIVPGLLNALKACISKRNLDRGQQLHQEAARNGLITNIKVANCLINMYAKCGSMTNAHAVFNEMQLRNVVSWTSLILGFANNNQSKTALELFDRMKSSSCQPDAMTYLAALMACSDLAAKEEGQEVTSLMQGRRLLMKIESLQKAMEIHRQAEESGCLDIFTENNLIDLYGKCGSMLDSRLVFDKMQHHSSVSWTSLIMGYTENGEERFAVELFEYLRIRYHQLAPSNRTFVAALSACGSLAEKEDSATKAWCLEKGMDFHFQAWRSGFAKSDLFVGNSLIEMYSRCGSLIDARIVFDRMVTWTVVSWTSLMMGYVRNDESETALLIFEAMMFNDCELKLDAQAFIAALIACRDLAAKEEGKQIDGRVVKVTSLQRGLEIHSRAAGYDSDIYVANTLIDMYATCGSMTDARHVFERMRSRTVVTWNSLILGYAENGEAEVALQIFQRMKLLSGCKPNSRTYVAALAACGCLGALETGKSIHEEIRSSKVEGDPFVTTSLVDFYGKCGSLADAEEVFDRIGVKSVVNYSALVAAYSSQGDARRALEVFEAMVEKGMKPDGVTFLSVLTACSHAGLVERGKECFEAMEKIHGVEAKIEHYNCVVDMLGRSNHLEEAVKLVREKMPFQATSGTWMSVLGACKKWKNVEVGRVAFGCLIDLDERQAASYLLMGNIYGSVGMWKEQKEVLEMRRKVGAWKRPGQSWCADDAGKIHAFRAGETDSGEAEGGYGGGEVARSCC